MRKVTLFFVMVALFAMSIVPAFAQDEMAEPTQTIAEIVVASTTAETPEFTTLLTAIQAADPAVLETLSGEGSFTVFAPTDAAFATLFETLGEEAVADLLADPETLTDILLFHVYGSGAIPSEQITQAFNSFGTDQLLTLGTMNGQSLDFSYDEVAGVNINGSFLVTTDIWATNGVIHVIDAVLVPESRDIVTIILDATTAETPEFSNLLMALNSADLLNTLVTPEAVYTVFAPIDAAFASLDADTLTAVFSDTDLLTSVLTYHVVEGRLTTTILNEVFANSGREGYELPAWFVGIEGNSMEILTVNGETIIITSVSTLEATVNNANVLQLDVDASNGVIHFIDAVLVPAGE